MKTKSDCADLQLTPTAAEAERSQLSFRRQLFALILVSTTVASLGVGCRPNQPPGDPGDPGGSIPPATSGTEYKEYRGYVVDDTTNQSVASAKVKIDFGGTSDIEFTDSEGQYVLNLSSNTRSKSSRVRVEANGYKIYEREIALDSSDNFERIRLAPLPRYIGRVVDRSSGNPIQGVEVVLDFKGKKDTAFTDGDGIFIINLPENTNRVSGRVRFLANGYKSYDQSIDRELDGSEVEDIRLVRAEGVFEFSVRLGEFLADNGNCLGHPSLGLEGVPPGTCNWDFTVWDYKPDIYLSINSKTTPVCADTYECNVRETLTLDAKHQIEIFDKDLQSSDDLAGAFELVTTQDLDFEQDFVLGRKGLVKVRLIAIP